MTAVDTEPRPDPPEEPARTLSALPSIFLGGAVAFGGSWIAGFPAGFAVGAIFRVFGVVSDDIPSWASPLLSLVLLVAFVFFGAGVAAYFRDENPTRAAVGAGAVYWLLSLAFTVDYDVEPMAAVVYFFVLVVPPAYFGGRRGYARRITSP